MPSRVRSMLVLAALLTLIATAVFRFGTGESDAAVSSTLHATVGPAFDISLTFDDGSAVSALPAGSLPRARERHHDRPQLPPATARASSRRPGSTTWAR